MDDGTNNRNRMIKVDITPLLDRYKETHRTPPNLLEQMSVDSVRFMCWRECLTDTPTPVVEWTPELIGFYREAAPLLRVILFRTGVFNRLLFKQIISVVVNVDRTRADLTVIYR